MKKIYIQHETDGTCRLIDFNRNNYNNGVVFEIVDIKEFKHLIKIGKEANLSDVIKWSFNRYTNDKKEIKRI